MEKHRKSLAFLTRFSFICSRARVQALINTFGKFSHAMNVVQTMRGQTSRRYWTKVAIAVIVSLMFCVGLPALVLSLRRRRAAKAATAADHERMMNAGYSSSSSSSAEMDGLDSKKLA